ALPAGAAVDPFADQVRLPGVRRVFSDDAGQARGHPPQERPRTLFATSNPVSLASFAEPCNKSARMLSQFCKLISAGNPCGCNRESDRNPADTAGRGLPSAVPLISSRSLLSYWRRRVQEL